MCSLAVLILAFSNFLFIKGSWLPLTYFLFHGACLSSISTKISTNLQRQQSTYSKISFWTTCPTPKYYFVTLTKNNPCLAYWLVNWPPQYTEAMIYWYTDRMLKLNRITHYRSTIVTTLVKTETKNKNSILFPKTLVYELTMNVLKTYTHSAFLSNKNVESWSQIWMNHYPLYPSAPPKFSYFLSQKLLWCAHISKTPNNLVLSGFSYFFHKYLNNFQ